MNLDIKLGNENKIIDKLKMLKGFYAYQLKNIDQEKYKQLDLVYNDRLVAIKK